MRTSATRTVSIDLTKYVAVCVSCHNWQIDVTPRGRSECGGFLGAMRALGEIHALDHVHNGECVGAGGRVKVLGQWAEAPEMADGKPADGTLGFQPLPRWWVWR